MTATLAPNAGAQAVLQWCDALLPIGQQGVLWSDGHVIARKLNMTDESTFHESSGTVRFWVLVGEQHVGASVGKETLHYRYHPTGRDDMPLSTFVDHVQEIHEAVRRRVAGGSVEPVMLRDADLRALPALHRNR